MVDIVTAAMLSQFPLLLLVGVVCAAAAFMLRERVREAKELLWVIGTALLLAVCGCVVAWQYGLR